MRVLYNEAEPAHPFVTVSWSVACGVISRHGVVVAKRGTGLVPLMYTDDLNFDLDPVFVQLCQITSVMQAAPFIVLSHRVVETAVFVDRKEEIIEGEGHNLGYDGEADGG